MRYPIPDDGRPGDPLTDAMFGGIFGELSRRRNMVAAAPLVLEDTRDANAAPRLSIARPERFLIQLTGPYAAGYPWQEVVIDQAGGVQLTGRTGGSFDDPAFERRNGNTSLAGGSKVYQAVRDLGTGVVTFPARRTPVVSTCCPNIFTNYTLTTAGQTVTIKYYFTGTLNGSPLPSYWWGQAPFPFPCNHTPGAHPDRCENSSTIWLQFWIYCTQKFDPTTGTFGPWELAVYYSFATTGPFGNSVSGCDPCDYQDGLNNLGQPGIFSGSSVRAAVSACTGAPLTANGTWPNFRDRFCPGLVGPLAGQTWTLS